MVLILSNVRPGNPGEILEYSCLNRRRPHPIWRTSGIHDDQNGRTLASPVHTTALSCWGALQKSGRRRPWSAWLKKYLVYSAPVRPSLPAFCLNQIGFCRVAEPVVEYRPGRSIRQNFLFDNHIASLIFRDLLTFFIENHNHVIF